MFALVYCRPAKPSGQADSCADAVLFENSRRQPTATQPNLVPTEVHIFGCHSTRFGCPNLVPTGQPPSWGCDSPSDDGHLEYAIKLLDYAKHTFRSTICPEGLNQSVLALALGVSPTSFSKYLNAKLGETGVGKVERALDGPRGNGGTFKN